MKNKWLTLMMSIMSVGLGLLMIQGCEDEKDSDLDDGLNYQSSSRDPYDAEASETELLLTPTSKNATRAGEQFTFTVKGGQSPYTWSVADSTAGRISVSETSQYVTYTVTTISENEVVVQDNRGLRASANINRSYSTLSISPSGPNVSRTVPATYDFTASGGLSPYSWTSFNQSLGTIGASGTTVTYTVKNAPASATNNTITVIDANGDKAETTVYHTL